MNHFLFGQYLLFKWGNWLSEEVDRFKDGDTVAKKYLTKPPFFLNSQISIGHLTALEFHPGWKENQERIGLLLIWIFWFK